MQPKTKNMSNFVRSIENMQKFIFTIVLIIAGLNLMATHNRAGEITFKHISGYTYQITILTYTYSPSPADRPSLDVNWGDGTSSIINRTTKTFIGNLTNRNIYIGTHTYSGPGSFMISMEDPNRNGGVINIINSINASFYLETELVIHPFLGLNNSVQLLNAPIDNGCLNTPFLHNPGAFDPDGDSISYALAPCKGNQGQVLPGYSDPTTSNIFEIDPVTGTLTWDSPIMQGEYNIAIIIYEWRFGIRIGSVRRDMQITIASCNNDPPVISLVTDTCVEVGTTLTTDISATDINNHNITLTAVGGPFLLANNPASYNQPFNGFGFVNSTLNWTPLCEHVQKQPYQLVFKAKDNGSPVNLVDIKTMRIKVVAPPPQNLTASPSGNSVQLNWSKHFCSQVVRYDIYRHNGFINYLPNNCETGVPAWTGYVKIASTSSVNDTTYLDDDNGYGLIHGNQYCYMVVALFPDSAESYPSLEACATLTKDVPIMTHVTVDSTSDLNGQITVRWTRPADFDSIALPGPYKYLINHAVTASSQLFVIDSLSNLYDTVFVLKSINTRDYEHRFKIDFLNDSPSNRLIVGSTQETYSVFLKIIPLDKKLRLEWNEFVPWTNYNYVIYKQNQNGTFDSIGQTSSTFYIDSNLVNGQNYCYRIKSIGEYSSATIPRPLVNYSQVACEMPVDNESPCPPKLLVEADCQLIQNLISWNDVTKSCGHDVVYYTLYYRPALEGDFEVIYQTSSQNDTSFLHQNLISIAGCYTITATDSNGNVSPFSELVCIDIDECNPYVLPNVFTPNNDGYNDYFTPFPYDLVRKIEITIFNRWGVPVFKTEDPDINWNGKDMNSNNDCSDGVYFYVCHVYELRLEGEVKREITGSVTIIRKN